MSNWCGKGESMSRKQRETNQSDLTAAEISLLRGSGVPASIREYLTRSHEDVGLKASAYRKIAAAASAEREALIEVHALGLVRAKLGANSDRVQVRAVEALEAENDRLRRELRHATAIPALAVNSND